jgi:2-haloacid dehalogenase
MNPLFEKLFGDRRVLREWFGHLIMYSMTITLSGLYKDFFSLGQGILQMLGDIHGVSLRPSDIDEINKGMMTMPAHADLAEGLQKTEGSRFRRVTLRNSPPYPEGQSPLEHAGLAKFFEGQFSIESVRAYKPAPLAYHLVEQESDGSPSSCCMVAAHLGHARFSKRRFLRCPDHSSRKCRVTRCGATPAQFCRAGSSSANCETPRTESSVINLIAKEMV